MAIYSMISLNDGIELERTIARFEKRLSEWAAIPVIGTFAGIARILLGIIQTIGGILGMLVSIPFLFNEKARNVFARSADHVINGIANIVTGAFEAIPIVGTAMYGCRSLCRMQYMDSNVSDEWDDGQSHMVLFKYSVLEKYPTWEG